MNSAEWTEATTLYSLPLEEALEIINDGLTHGFSFKVEDGKLYYTDMWF